VLTLHPYHLQLLLLLVVARRLVGSLGAEGLVVWGPGVLALAGIQRSGRWAL
jgi:hypothetical protein